MACDPKDHEPKNHHYVPAFYLAGWQRPEAAGKLIEFRKLHTGEVKRKPVSARATGFKRHLYSRPTGEPGVLDHSLESGFMSRLDDRANRVLLTLLKNPRGLDVDQRMLWGRFMLSLLLRSPDEMQANAKGFQLARERPDPVLEDWYRQVRPVDAPATFADLMDNIPDHEHEETWHGSLKTIMNDGKVLTILVSLEWHIRRLSGAHLTLLTSDRPVISNNRLGHSDGFLFMPLSPDTLFYALPARAPRHPTLTKGSDNQAVRFCNRALVRQAREYVWANDDCQQVFIERHLGAEPTKTFSAIATEALGRESGG